MILTNKHNIPDIIVRAIGEDYPPQPGRVSVSALIDAPLIRYLKMKHWDKLEEDVSDRLWSLLGRAAHNVIEKGKSHTDIAEMYMKTYVNGMAVTGRSDIIQGDELIDLKITSVYSFLLGEKESWAKQLNAYNYLVKVTNGKEIKRAAIYGILRDWQKNKQHSDWNYPEIPFFETEISLWPLEQTQKYIEERVWLHKAADQYLALQTSGVEFPPPNLLCTDADRWVRPTTYAVMKKGNKRAMRVLDTFDEATSWIKDSGKDGLYIEHRPGLAVRCEQYCICKPVCPMVEETVS